MSRQAGEGPQSLRLTSRITTLCLSWYARVVLGALLGSLAIGAYAQTQGSTAGAIEGAVCDARGKPVADAAVRLEQDGSPVAIVHSDLHGGFLISVSQPGSFTLSAGKSGLRSHQTTVHAGSGEAREHVTLVLSEAAANGGGEENLPAPADAPMEFADQPNFTVAGVTDWTAAGGHGSDASLRASEALTRETLTLKPEGDSTKGVSQALPHDRAALERARERTRQTLAQKETAEEHRRLGDLDEELGDPLAAVHEDEQAVRLDPSEENYFAWGSELLLHRAVWQAAEVLGNGAKAYPKSARMLAALGTALFASARYEEAALRFCAASDLAPEDPQPYAFMGKIETAAPSPLPCVEEKLARFAQQQPGNSHADYLYAMAIWKRLELPPNPEAMQRVEALLVKAVTIDPKFADASLQLGLLNFNRRNYRRAIDYYLQAVAADPQLGEAHYRLGVAYDRTGEPAKAKREFELHDQIEKSQAAETERQRREVKQFVVVLRGQPAAPPD